MTEHVTWITGASSGIGEALALACARRDHRLVLSARRKEALNRVKQACIAAGSSEESILVLPLDVTDDGAMPQAVADVLAVFGRIDLLINNAGISQRSLCVDTELSVYRRIFDVDVIGQIALTRAVLPTLLKQASGHIAVTSSIAGKVGVPYRTGYCAAKHAVIGFYDALRAELASSGIKVSTILPGFVRTNISEAAVTGDGSQFGRTDHNIANGMDPLECAEIILRKLERGVPEFVVATGKEKHSVWLNRFFPGLIRRVVPKLGKP